MSDIKRYDPAEVLTDRWEMGGMDEKQDGDYVRADDHEEALAAKDARIAELEQKLHAVTIMTPHIVPPKEGDVNAYGVLLQPAAESCRECKGSRVQVAEHVLPCPVCTGTPTPSEDGREVNIVAFLMRPDFCEPYVGLHRDSMVSGAVEPLMTVAQHSRIVAAKDAEIAALKSQLFQGGDLEADIAKERDDLRAELDRLRAQLSRQVGVDKREACGSMMLSNEVCKLPAGHDGPCGYFQKDEGAALAQAEPDQTAIETALVIRVEKLLCAKLGREWSAAGISIESLIDALAPAAVVMPERKPHGKAYWEDGYNAALDEVARLNRRAIPVELLERIDHALQHARVFIRNGVELGFIRMPDDDTPDPAKETLPTVEAAQGELRALLGKESK